MTIIETAQEKRISAWALWPLGLATALSLMGDATLYAVLPTHFADAGIAIGSVGIILSVNRIIRLFTNGPAGWFFDRLPDRRTLFVGSLALGVFSTVIYAQSTGFEILFLARLLWGLAWSGIWVGGNAIVLQMAPSSQRGHWVGVFQVWFFLGSATGSFFGGSLTDALGYRGALWIGAGISAVGAIAAALALSSQHTNNGQNGTAAKTKWHSSVLPDLRGISGAIWATATAQAINRLAAAGIVAATLGLVVQANFGTDLRIGAFEIGVASMTGALLAARTLISVVGAPIAGTLSDRAKHRWGWLTIMLCIGAIGTGIMPAPNLLALVLGIIASSLASGGTQSLTTALIGDLSTPSEHGKNLGLFYTAGDLGSAIGPIVAYALLPITGLLAIYVGCGLLMLATAAWSMRFMR